MDHDRKYELLKNFNADFSQLDKYIKEINFFRILRLEKLEIRHSNFLAWLLNINANHGVGTVFVSSFLGDILKNNVDKINGLSIDLINQAICNFTIDREHYFIHNGKPRLIDLLLVNKKDHILICIENKIKSKQHSGQLCAYKNYINNQSEFKSNSWYKIFIYLTPTNEEIKDVDWIKIPYDYVVNSIEKVFSECPRIAPEIKFFMENYISIIRRDIMHTEDELRKKCLEIYNSNKEAFDLIYEYKINPLTQTIVNVLNEETSKGKIKFLPSKRKGNTEFRFTTLGLENIVHKDPSNKNVWKTDHRILYRILVTYIDGFPVKIGFTIVLTGEQNNPDSDRVIDIAQKNYTEFAVKKIIKKCKDYTIVYNGGSLDVKNLDDDFLNILKERLKKFIEVDSIAFESKF